METFMKKIYVLWLRQIKKYLRSRSRLLGALFEPLVFLLVLGYGLGSVFQRAGQGNYFDFLAPGIIGQIILFNAMFSGTDVIWDRQFGFLKETLVAPISRFNIMIGRTLGGASVATIQGTLVLLLALLFGFQPTNGLSVILAIGVMFLVALLFTSLGTMVASLLGDAQGFQSIMNFLVLPLFLLSGALFPLQGIPKVLALITRLDPLVYGVDALRALLTNTGYYGLGIDIAVLGAVTLVCLWLGGYFFKKIQA
jgi:ABC-2 type transport system permease protein